MRDSILIGSNEFAAAHGCEAPHKIVQFDLQPGTYVLQLTGATSQNVRLALTRTPHCVDIPAAQRRLELACSRRHAAASACVRSCLQRCRLFELEWPRAIGIGAMCSRPARADSKSVLRTTRARKMHS